MEGNAIRESRAAFALATLVGAWFMLTLAMSFVAGANFGTLKPDRLRQADQVFGALEAGPPREQALRYVASELNRRYFALYGRVQVGLAVLAGLAVWRLRPARPALRFLIALCALAALDFLFHLVPAITELGRQIDFMPRDPKPPEVADFDRLHHLAVGIETSKLFLLLLVLLPLLWPRRRSG